MRVGVLAVSAYAALIAGCMVFEELEREEPRPGFSHARHAQEGLSCEDCHFPDEGGGKPGMPSTAQCGICHSKLDANKPPEQRAAALFTAGKLREAGAGPLAPEISFSHGAHTDLGLACGRCHVGIETSAALDPGAGMLMADCQSCHESTGVDPACATCHREIRVDALPPNHTGVWRRVHGSVVRGGAEGAANDCSLCHTEGRCNQCHQDEPPANHNNLWRLKTHGVVAGMDRQSCTVCHTSSFCDRCHEETPPLNHKGGWGSPLDKHCVQCHFPLQGESCSICHRGTPSHNQAAPLPADHNPGMNCVMCHGLTAPLPHPDKGDSCIMCHN